MTEHEPGYAFTKKQILTLTKIAQTIHKKRGPFFVYASEDGECVWAYNAFIAVIYWQSDELSLAFTRKAFTKLEVEARPYNPFKLEESVKKIPPKRGRVRFASSGVEVWNDDTFVDRLEPVYDASTSLLGQLSHWKNLGLSEPISRICFSAPLMTLAFEAVEAAGDGPALLHFSGKFGACFVRSEHCLVKVMPMTDSATAHLVLEG